jgi:hypothetical protein
LQLLQEIRFQYQLVLVEMLAMVEHPHSEMFPQAVVELPQTLIALVELVEAINSADFLD